MNTNKQPIPKAGIIANLEQLKKDKAGFRTLIGSVTEFDDPGRSRSEIPCIPTLGAYYWLLKQGEQDDQKPHFQDEIYQILEGNGMFELGTKGGNAYKQFSIKAGDVIFVPARMPHKFISSKSNSNHTDLRIIIFFGPDWDGQPATEST